MPTKSDSFADCCKLAAATPSQRPETHTALQQPVRRIPILSPVSLRKVSGKQRNFLCNQYPKSLIISSRDVNRQ